MATNTFILPSVIASRALATLYNETVLAALINRDFESNFTGKIGDTVMVRMPAVFEANLFDRASGIVVQDATEESFPIVLDKLTDVSFSVTTEELTLDINDFDGQLLNPAMMAIVEGVDAAIADELIAASQQSAASGSNTPAHEAGGGTVTTNDSDEPLKALVAARVKLGRAKLPTLNRYAVISPEGAGQALSGDLIVQANTRGDTDGLVEAAIGRKFGFNVFESQVLGDEQDGGGRHDADGVAFHQDAVALVTRTPQIPMGKNSTNAAVESFMGLGLRVVYDYDISHKQDVVSVDFLYGVEVVRPYAAIQLDLGVS